MRDQTLWTALITPLLKGQTDLHTLSTLVARQEKAENGILLLGSTGEALNLMLDERKRIAEHVLRNKPSVPVMVGVGGANFSEQKEWIRFCERLGADAFLLVTPYYSRPGKIGQLRWFEGLMESCNTPCMLYNNPSRTSVKLSIEALALLGKNAQVFGVKEASGSMSEFAAYRSAAPHLSFYCGNDNETFSFCGEGAVGLISVTANLYPELTKTYVEHALRQEDSEIARSFTKYSGALSSQNPLSIKALLHSHGLIETSELALPLRIEDLQEIKALHFADQKISSLRPLPAAAESHCSSVLGKS